MNGFAITLWLCAAFVSYTYVGYPLLLGLWARLRPRPVRRAPFAGRFAVVLTVRDEEKNIARRLTELVEHVRATGLAGEIVVVSDGSSDATVALAREFEATGLVRVLETSENVGKAAALTLGCQQTTADVLLFADVRQTWATDTIANLLENFADPEVGAVSGDLVLQTSAGVMAGVGLYWRFEKWLRRRESLVYAQVGVTGAICGVRRELFRPIPRGTLLDDVYWPLLIAMLGRRVIHDERARAFDRLPERSRDEFRRKVRTLCGNYQLACRLPAALLPWRNPVWLAWISHKLCRLLVPWALLVMLLVTPLTGGTLSEAALIAQMAGYGVALAGLMPAVSRRSRLASAAASFLVLNTAAWLAFWVWLSGRAERSWQKVAYTASSPAPEKACSSR